MFLIRSDMSDRKIGYVYLLRDSGRRFDDSCVMMNLSIESRLPPSSHRPTYSAMHSTNYTIRT